MFAAAQWAECQLRIKVIITSRGSKLRFSTMRQYVSLGAFSSPNIDPDPIEAFCVLEDAMERYSTRGAHRMLEK